MRWTFCIALFSIVLSTSLAFGHICQVAPPEHANYCEHDAFGMCCAIDSGPGCYEVTCYSFDSCSWDAPVRVCE